MKNIILFFSLYLTIWSPQSFADNFQILDLTPVTERHYTKSPDGREMKEFEIYADPKGQRFIAVWSLSQKTESVWQEKSIRIVVTKNENGTYKSIELGENFTRGILGTFSDPAQIILSSATTLNIFRGLSTPVADRAIQITTGKGKSTDFNGVAVTPELLSTLELQKIGEDTYPFQVDNSGQETEALLGTLIAVKSDSEIITHGVKVGERIAKKVIADLVAGGRSQAEALLLCQKVFAAANARVQSDK